MTTINIRLNVLTTRHESMAFETPTVDTDGGRFYVAETNSYGLTRESKTAKGALIAFGTAELKDPESSHVSDYFAFGADDDKKVIAQQLRELADWFESQE